MKKFYDEDEKRKRFYSVKEASKILGVSTNTIYKYLGEGSLKGKRLNSRGRFKIPFSEIAPYLATEVSGDAAGVEEIQPGKKIGEKLTVWELWLGVSLVGLVLMYVLWNLGWGGVLGYKSSLLTDIGNAVVGYSGRTFSGFGNLISRLLPAQKPINEAQITTEIESNSLTEIVPEENILDLNYKIQETGGRTNELYANAQVLSASTQSLLGKSKTLTSAELTDVIGEMSQLLGTLSDSSDKKTIFAQINWLGESWDFSTIEAIKRAAGNISSILVSLKRQSLGAFTKPELTDLNNLVSEADLLQGLVGDIPDTLNENTLYGKIKSVEAKVAALDTKIVEIDKILKSWGSYSLSEKEDTIKSILSTSLSLNNLPKIEELIITKVPSEDKDTYLKNSLLSAKGVLIANKTHLTQKTGKPVVVNWLEWGSIVFKTLAINPSALAPQETTIKYYLPKEVRREYIIQADEGLKLNFDSQRSQYYVEANFLLNAGESKTFSLNVVDIWKIDKLEVDSKKARAAQLLGDKAVKVDIDKSLDKVSVLIAGSVTPEEHIAIFQEAASLIKGVDEKMALLGNQSAPQKGQVAGIRTFNYPTRSIVIWGSLVVLFSALATLIIHLRMAIAAFFVNIVRRLLKSLVSVSKLTESALRKLNFGTSR